MCRSRRGIPDLRWHGEAGKLRALAVTSATRSALLPDLPTINESGLPGYDVTSWYGVFAPAAVPEAIITRLATESLHSSRRPMSRNGLRAWVPNSPSNRRRVRSLRARRNQKWACGGQSFRRQSRVMCRTQLDANLRIPLK
jgi:hypothetical protein